MATALKFYFGKTAIQALKEEDLTGKVAVVTGATSGIGEEVAKTLAYAGCRVIATYHTRAFIEFAEMRMRRSITDAMANIEWQYLELASLENVARFADGLMHHYQSVDFLVCSAGVMATPYRMSYEGYEHQFQVNYLAYFKLIQCLETYLVESHTPVRIILVSCGQHRLGTLNLADFNFRTSPYSPQAAYRQAKLASVVFGRALARRYAPFSHVRVFIVDPGVTSTHIARYILGVGYVVATVSQLFVRSAQQGASSIITACISPKLASGAYIVDSQEGVPLPRASHPATQEQLWATSHALVANAEHNCHKPASFNPLVLLYEALVDNVLLKLVRYLPNMAQHIRDPAMKAQAAATLTKQASWYDRELRTYLRRPPANRMGLHFAHQIKEQQAKLERALAMRMSSSEAVDMLHVPHVERWGEYVKRVQE